MNCPVCTHPLQQDERQGIEIDKCPQCMGVWLDRGELEKILERSAAEFGQPSQWQAHSPGTDNRPIYRRNHDDDDEDDDDRGDRYRNQSQRPDEIGQPPRKKRSFLGELFDFD